jgi:hypothetical protein
VQWTTLTEINSDYIEVQSSPNGSTKWETIEKVEAKGESTARVDYEIMDYNPFEVTYYRLYAVDQDGKSEYSNIINVRRADATGKLKLSPNPAGNTLSVQSSTSKEEMGTMLIVDVAGAIMKKSRVLLRKGLNTIDVDLNELPSGLYLFSLQTEDEMQVQKFVKQ